MAQPSDKRPELLLLFSGSCPPKPSFSPAINLEHASWLVVMETYSLGEQEMENRTDNFGRS